MKSPSTSIIVPTYNNEDTIEACLRSLIRQTYPIEEIIVVNDGSTDKTEQILAKMAENFSPLIRVISTIHVGRSKARNLGWKNAVGNIFFFGEADAVYNEDYLEKAVKCLSADPAIGGVTLTGAPLKVESTFVTECIEVQNEIRRKLIDEGKITPSWAWVYRREAIDAVGGFDDILSQGEDRDLFIRVKKAGYSFGLVRGVNWYHRRAGGLLAYVRRCFLGGERRILYVLKNRDIGELLKSVVLPWVFLVLLIYAIFLHWLYLILIAVSLLMLFLIYKWVSTLKVGWKSVGNKKYLFLLPIFNMLTYLATAIGYNYGAMRVCLRKLTWR